MMLDLVLAATVVLCEPYYDRARELYGYVDCDGRVATKVKYVMANRFTAGGIAAVLDDSGWHYIDRFGSFVIRPMIYDNGPDYFKEGLARFVRGGRYGFFDDTGTIVIPATYEFAFPFEGGKAKVGEGCNMVAVGEHRRIECESWRYIVRPRVGGTTR